MLEAGVVPTPRDGQRLFRYTWNPAVHDHEAVQCIVAAVLDGGVVDVVVVLQLHVKRGSGTTVKPVAGPEGPEAGHEIRQAGYNGGKSERGFILPRVNVDRFSVFKTLAPRPDISHVHAQSYVPVSDGCRRESDESDLSPSAHDLNAAGVTGVGDEVNGRVQIAAMKIVQSQRTVLTDSRPEVLIKQEDVAGVIRAGRDDPATVLIRFAS